MLHDQRLEKRALPAARVFILTVGLTAVAARFAAPSAIAADQKAGNSAVVPAPREGGWMERHERFLERAKQGHIDVLFLGDSITEGWHNNEVWKAHYEPLHAANFGIGGDRTQHVLWRLEHGEIDGISPKVVALMIGTNNSRDNSADEIAAGITTIVKTLRDKLPKTKVLLLAVFPRGEKPNPTREKLAAVNAAIAKLHDGKTVRYLDIGPSFRGPDGTISKDIMPDFLHLSVGGYQIWADAIQPTLHEMLGKS